MTKTRLWNELNKKFRPLKSASAKRSICRKYVPKFKKLGYELLLLGVPGDHTSWFVVPSKKKIK